MLQSYCIIKKEEKQNDKEQGGRTSRNGAGFGFPVCNISGQGVQRASISKNRARHLTRANARQTAEQTATTKQKNKSKRNLKKWNY